MEPLFLSLEEVLQIHEDQVRRYGGSLGVGDLGLLESALAVPCSGSVDRYFHADLYEMAAAYLFHLVQNHPFVDGNKRVGAMAAFTFLKLNGLTLRTPEDELEELVMKVAQSHSSKSAVAEFLRKYARR